MYVTWAKSVFPLSFVRIIKERRMNRTYSTHMETRNVYNSLDVEGRDHWESRSE
jgi:hypothetical protein